MVKIMVNFAAFQLNVSNSFNLSRAVLSNTIMASAKIAKLERNTVGNCMSGAFLYSMLPKNMPARSKSNTSGILSLLPTHEQMTPTKRSTAIAVVIISASCMGIYHLGVYINFRHYVKLSTMKKLSQLGIRRFTLNHCCRESPLLSFLNSVVLVVVCVIN